MPTDVLTIALYQMPVTLVVVKWPCRKENTVFIQGEQFYILTKFTLHRESLHRPCKYQKRFNETMRDDSFQSTYYPWRGHSGKAARHPSALLLVATVSWAIIGIFGQNSTFEPKPSWQPLLYLTVSSPPHSHWHGHTNTLSLPSSSVAWSSCKVPKPSSCIVSWWERTSSKQWNELIWGFASRFTKGPCSKSKFQCPLVKNYSSLHPHPSHVCSFINGVKMDY